MSQVGRKPAFLPRRRGLGELEAFAFEEFLDAVSNLRGADALSLIPPKRAISVETASIMSIMPYRRPWHTEPGNSP